MAPCSGGPGHYAGPAASLGSSHWTPWRPHQSQQSKMCPDVKDVSWNSPHCCKVWSQFYQKASAADAPGDGVAEMVPS